MLTKTGMVPGFQKHPDGVVMQAVYSFILRWREELTEGILRPASRMTPGDFFRPKQASVLVIWQHYWEIVKMPSRELPFPSLAQCLIR